jgi:lambda repressor-like predicted transcriptional regulator
MESTANWGELLFHRTGVVDGTAMTAVSLQCSFNTSTLAYTFKSRNKQFQIIIEIYLAMPLQELHNRQHDYYRRQYLQPKTSFYLSREV